MKIARRRLLKLAAAVAVAPILSSPAGAQAYPSRPVHLVVGFPPGGVADLYARLIAQWLSDRLGQQFVVDNRAGAGGSIATEVVTKAVPDGYTLLLTSASDAWNTALYDNLSFNYVQEIAPVAGIVRVGGVLVVQPSSGLRTLPELIAYAKANPGQLTMASGGVGSASHVFWELFKSMARIDMVHVPYRGEGPAILDLLSGHVRVMIPTIPPSIEYIRAGKLVPIAVTLGTRSELLPGVPTMGEFVPGCEAGAWVGIGAPRGTPPEIIEKINREVNAALADPQLKARIADQGGTASPGSPAEFGKFIVDFTDKWARVIRAANIKIE